MKRGIHARADRRAARRVITPSHSAPVCPGSCPNTQTARLAPHIKDLRPDGSLGSGPAQHRGRLCHRPGKSQRSTNAVVITVENPPESFHDLMMQKDDSKRFELTLPKVEGHLLHAHTVKPTHTVIKQTFNEYNESLRKFVTLGEFSISWTSPTDLTCISIVPEQPSQVVIWLIK